MQTEPSSPKPSQATDPEEGNRARHAPLILDLQDRLEAAADPATRDWFEGYLKHAIRYRGVRTPEVSRILSAWRADCALGGWAPEAELALAADLIRQRKCEDKLAGIIWIQKHLSARLDPEAMLDTVENLFGEGAIGDWSTNDWLCARVLGPLIRRHGMVSAMRVAEWRSSGGLRQRRTSAVALRSVADQTAFQPLITETVACLVVEQQRFIRTGVGRLIADLSRHSPEFATELADRHIDDLSPEVIRRHLKLLPDTERYRRKARRQRQDVTVTSGRDPSIQRCCGTFKLTPGTDRETLRATHRLCPRNAHSPQAGSRGLAHWGAPASSIRHPNHTTS